MVTEHPTFDELFARCRRSAVHLEMRDMYTPDDPVYLEWKAGVAINPVEQFRDWYDLVVATVRRGVEIRRARIVSEPISDFIRHEYEVTPVLNVPAGERPRGRSMRPTALWASPRTRGAGYVVPL